VSRWNRAEPPPPQYGERQRSELEVQQEQEINIRYTPGTFVNANLPGRKPWDDYTKSAQKPVGAGGQGEVHMAFHTTTGAPRAVKVVPRDRVLDNAKFTAEVEIWKVMDHPHIVKLYETYSDFANYYLVMEPLHGGDLFDVLQSFNGRIPEEPVAIIMRQVFRALRWIHSQGIIHGDVKPENFMLAESNPVPDTMLKMIDFGWSERCQQGGSVPFRQRRDIYGAPEVIRERNTECSMASDVWSAGIMMYALLAGVPPFVPPYVDRGRSLERPTLRFNNREYWPCHEVSAPCKELLSAMLQRDPKSRLTAAQCLDHPWTTQWIHKRPPPYLRPNFFQGPQVAALERLVTFYSSNLTALGKAAWQVVALRLSDDELSCGQGLFLFLDRDGTGFISERDLREVLGAFGIAGPEVDAMLDEVRHTRDARLGYTEFLAAALDKRQHNQASDCNAAFLVFDRFRSEFLHSDSLRETFGDGADQVLQEACAKAGATDVDKLEYVDFEKLFFQAAAASTPHFHPVTP